ncbi:MAG: protein-L-isoaspartate(D-aspartate) O-methyltransferase [Prolixibacteraceae bacterium]|nr:protein-L-isoaspartate(D-aspartate) O-methyltransferase [Prolixibacteraceae bacterium]
MYGFVMLLVFIGFPQANPNAFNKERDNMVRSQIEARGINNQEILSAFRKVPRHMFVPKNSIPYAYHDGPLAIGEGQTISQPYIVAYMTDVLNLKPGEKILEIGTGSGYQAAILAEMDAEVFTIEIFKSLSERAQKTIERLGYKSVHFKIGDGYKGWPEKAPFDAIIVTCSPEEIPPPLVSQLADGGRMIIPVGETHSIQYLVLATKMAGEIKKQKVMPVRFVPMINKKGKTY